MLISAGDIIKKSIALYRENAKLFLTYMALLFVPILTILLVNIFLLIKDAGGLGPESAFVYKAVLSSTSLIIIRVIAFFVFLVTFWFSLAFIRVLANKYSGQSVGSVGQELQKVKTVFWPALLASILVSLIILGAILLPLVAILLGIFKGSGITILIGSLLTILTSTTLAIWLAFTKQAAILDEKKPITAIKTSKMLVSGRWWRVFWRLIAPGFVFTLLLLIIQFIASLSGILGTMFGIVGVIMSLVIILAANFIVIPLLIIAPTILYIELKKTPAPTKNA